MERVRVSDLTATSYCERKMAFDRKFGRHNEPSFVRRRAEEGIHQHKRFEREVQGKQGFLAWLIGLLLALLGLRKKRRKS